MKVVYIENYQKFNLENLTLALGYFDGVHLAHQKLFKKTIEVSKKTNTKSAILTFNENVIDYINHNKSKHLTSFQDKVDIAMSFGFDYIIQLELTKDFIKLNYKEFINLFLKRQSNIVCGFDYSFGYNGEGKVTNLKNELNNVYVIDCETINGVKIGSKYIKELLEDGKIKDSNYLLGRPYKISGTLSKRNKFYSLSLNNYCSIKSGLYEAIIKFNNKELNSILKIKKDEDNNLLIIKNEIEELKELLEISSISIDLLFIKEVDVK